MLTLYKDRKNRFEANVKIDGASSANAIVRLILQFKTRTLMFDGAVNGQRAVVEVPKLSEIDEQLGRASLEVIADQTYFKAWEDNFELELQKRVAVDSINVERDEEVNVVVNEVTLDDDRTDEEIEHVEIFVDGVSNKNRFFVENLSKRNDKDPIELDEDYTPSDVVRQWGEEVFTDLDSEIARISMFEVDKGINK